MPILGRWVNSNTTYENKIWGVQVIPPGVLSLIASSTGNFVNRVLNHRSLLLQLSLWYLLWGCCWHTWLLFLPLRHLLIKTKTEWGGHRVSCIWSPRTEDSVRQGMGILICWKIWTWKVRPEGGWSHFKNYERPILVLYCIDWGIWWQIQQLVKLPWVAIHCDNFTKEFSFHPKHWDKSMVRSKKNKQTNKKKNLSIFTKVQTFDKVVQFELVRWVLKAWSGVLG